VKGFIFYIMKSYRKELWLKLPAEAAGSFKVNLP
jgi:hypothetical protein